MTAPDTDTLAGLLAECTPGPWIVEVEAEPDDDHPAIYVCGPDTVCDATVVATMGWASGRKNADARLIALAPSLAAETIALRAQAAKDKARIERLEAALQPFAEAWGVALQQAGAHPGSLRTLGPLGALAAHQVSGVHFQRARAALEDGE